MALNLLNLIKPLKSTIYRLYAQGQEAQVFGNQELEPSKGLQLHFLGRGNFWKLAQPVSSSKFFYLSSSHQKDALLESKHWIFVDRQLPSVGHLVFIYLQGAELKGLGLGTKSLGKNGKEAATGHDKKTSGFGQLTGAK